MKVLGIIPARYGSTRLPAKPLIDINGKTMIEWVWAAASSSKLNEVIVATDHYDIYSLCKNKGINVALTSDKHVSGTDRIIEVSNKNLYKNYDFYINIQGDEPLIQSADINNLIESVLNQNQHIHTLLTNLEEKDYKNRNSVKAYLNEENMEIVVFTRSPIYNPSQLDLNRFKKHIGIYAFSAEVLRNISKIKDKTINEIEEKLEQLRWLDHGFKIRAVITDNKTISIDTKEDLNELINFLKND